MNNLQKLREDRDIKQIEVANYLGVVHQTYSKIEKNIESAKAQTLKKIAEFFNVSIDYLLGLIDDPLPLHRSKITPPPVRWKLYYIENKRQGSAGAHSKFDK